MAKPKPGSKPEPLPAIPTIETDVSPLRPADEVPIPTIQADVSPLRSDGSTSIGAFTPEALAPRPAAPIILPRSNSGAARPLRSSSTGSPPTVSGDAGLAPSSAGPVFP